LSQIALHKKNGLKLGIIASCILIPFLFCYAENNHKVAENGAVSLSSKPDISKDVKQIQTLLALLKYNPGPIDGILGNKTTKAISTFQLDIGVPVTGKIDKNLKSQLDRAYRFSITRTKEQTEDDKEKPQINREKPRVIASQDIKLFSKPEESAIGNVPDVNRPKELGLGPQKELTQKDRDMKPENQYLKYIKIGFPIIAIIFLAYFYRTWTRLHEKKRDEKRSQKAKPEAERPEKAKPEEEYEEFFEVHDLEKEMTDHAAGKAQLDRQDPTDYQDPSHPAYITPVVRRKVWIRNKGQCAACGSRKDLQYDYIVAISEGGSNTLDNLQLLCKTCNQEKSVKYD
jgi:5-methylcytosine-specific restriction endonuclease McrA